MAMNEDSVVSSLNELRRMANDRAKRETEARARVEDRSSGSWGHGRRSEGGRIRATEIRGTIGGYQDAGAAAAHAPTLMGGHDAGSAPQGGFGGYGYGYGHPVQSASLPDIAHEPPPQKSSVGAVLLTILLLGGAAGGGYWKLQQDFQATLKARDAALLSAEEGRNKAVETAAKMEQLLKAELAKGEQRARSAASAPPPAAEVAKPSEAPAPAAKPAVAAKASKAEKSKKGRRGASRRLAKAAPVVAPAEEEKKPAALPRVVGKKKYNDDPLAGLKM